MEAIKDEEYVSKVKGTIHNDYLSTINTYKKDHLNKLDLETQINHIGPYTN